MPPAWGYWAEHDGKANWRSGGRVTARHHPLPETTPRCTFASFSSCLGIPPLPFGLSNPHRDAATTLCHSHPSPSCVAVPCGHGQESGSSPGQPWGHLTFVSCPGCSHREATAALAGPAGSFAPPKTNTQRGRELPVKLGPTGQRESQDRLGHNRAVLAHTAPTTSTLAHRCCPNSALPVQHLAHPAWGSGEIRCVLRDVGERNGMLHLSTTKVLLGRAINVVKTQRGFHLER